MRIAALPLALATSLAAVESPIRDVRLGVELGLGARSTYHYDDAGGIVIDEDVDDTPLQISLGYVRGLGGATHGALAGVHLVYGRGGGDIDDNALVDEIETRRIALDIEVGYARQLASTPALHLECAVFAGYVRENHGLTLLTDGGHFPFGGSGWESGARVGGFYALDAHWQVGAVVRYLFERETDSRRLGVGGEAWYETEGLHAGLSLGYRL